MQCLPCSYLREIQVETKCREIPFKLSKVQTLTICSLCCRARGPFIHFWSNCKMVNPYRNLAVFSKIIYASKLQPTVYLGIHPMH